MRRRNDSFRLTDVMDRSLRVLAGRLSTDARVWTGVHGRFGRRRLLHMKTYVHRNHRDMRIYTRRFGMLRL